MTNFSIQTSHPDDRTTIIRLNGEFSGPDVSNFEQEFLIELSNTKSQFVIDLSNTPYIDSSGIGLMMECAKAAGEEGKRMFLLSAQDAVQRVIQTVGLDRLAKVLNDLDELKN